MVATKKRKSKKRINIDGSGDSIKVNGIPIVRDAREAFKGLSKDEVIGIDLETTGFSAWKNDVALVQMYGEQSKTLAVIQISNGVLPDAIKDLFTKNRKFIVHNGVGFDMWFLDTHGVPWEKSSWHDTLVGETVLASTGRRDVSKNLRASVKRRLGMEIDKDIEHGNWGADRLSDRQLEYAAQDVIHLPSLYRSHLEKAEKSDELQALKMEMELAPVVARMSINGLPMIEKRLIKYVEEQRELIKSSEAYLMKKLGKINLGSHVQLKKALHNIGIEVPSTGQEVLAPMLMFPGPHVEVIEEVLNWKHGAQRIKMYKPEWMAEHIVNDWVHPHFWQCSADTTRFTSSNPNLQQVPKDSRHIIGGLKGHKIVSVDYSQIEVRIAAKIAEDEVLLDALEQEDVHAAIAAEVFGVRLNKVTKEQRKLSKALTFTLLFGGGSTTLFNHARVSGGSMTYEQASELAFRFFSRFKGLHSMKKKAERIAQRPGPAFIRLPNRNRRILVGRNKRSTVILNTMVQGTAAVGIKAGILEANRRGLMKYVGSTVHDELVAVVPNKLAKSFSAELSEAMQVGMKSIIDITVKTEATIGDVWQA